MTALNKLELIGTLGYIGVGLETIPGTAVTPTDFIPYYDEGLDTNLNLDTDSPAVGLFVETYQVLQGQRDHSGPLELLAEPNTSVKLLNMLLTVGAPTGSNPYTYVATPSGTTRPATYTIDVSIGGQQVKRFVGCGLEKLGHKFDKNVQHWTGNVSALGSFTIRTLASTPTGTNPYTVVLDATGYDPNPTNGLVVGDIMTMAKADGTAVTNFTIASITNGTTFTTTTNVTTFAAADQVFIRPATVSLSALVAQPFSAARTNYCFGATASAALSATPTRVEPGSAWEITSPFNNAKGEMRLGGFDPASLVRLPPTFSVKVKKFFASESDLAAWLNITKQALVVRHYTGAANIYEFRVTFNNMKIKAGSIVKTKSKGVLYAEMEYIPQWDTSDTQQVAVTVINALSVMS